MGDRTCIRLVAVGLGVLAVLTVSAAVMGEMPGWMIPVGIAAMVTVFIGAVLSDASSETIPKRFPSDGLAHDDRSVAEMRRTAAERMRESYGDCVFPDLAPPVRAASPIASTPVRSETEPPTIPPQPIDYADYLKSSTWKRTRAKKLADAGHSCQLCGKVKRLEVHHNNYDRIGKERMSDLLVLCRDCHQHFHNRLRVRR